MKIRVLIFFFILSYNCFAQKNDLFKFLEASKSFEFPESKKIISDYSFGQDVGILIFESSFVSGMFFSTDNAKIKGFKAIVNCKIQMKSDNTFKEERLLFVMYYDKIKKHWSVIDYKSIMDPQKEYSMIKSGLLNKIKNSESIEYYPSIVYWGLMAGKINESVKIFDEIAYTSDDSFYKIVKKFIL